MSTPEVLATLVSVFCGLFINILIISSVTTALQQMDSKGSHEKMQLDPPECNQEVRFLS